MSGSSIEAEYNEIVSRSGWNRAFQVGPNLRPYPFEIRFLKPKFTESFNAGSVLFLAFFSF